VLVIGVDPGLTRFGFGLVRRHPDRKLEHITSGILTTSPQSDPQKRLLTLADGFEQLLIEHQPQAVALERVFSQANVSTVIGVAQISGIVLYLAEKNGIPVSVYTPTQVKAAVTGYGKAEKAQVANMVRRILALPDLKVMPDETDALALAVSHLWHPLVSVPPNGAAAAQHSTASSSPLTPAQKIWLEAERQRGSRGKKL
jgi:crossover junction endodeoxyribonuclease RuvC